MKAIYAAVLSGIVLIIIPIALVSVPAAAVDAVRTAEPPDNTLPPWADCGISLECLR